MARIVTCSGANWRILLDSLRKNNNELFMTPSNQRIQASPASPWKRVFAWVYDLLPAFGVFILTLVLGIVLAYLVLSPFFKDVSATIRNHPLWWAFLTFGVSIYYTWCWQKAGQTVGMRTWRLQLVKSDGKCLGWYESYIRAFLSFGGIANLWAFVDAENRGWHDIAVDAYVVEVPKRLPTEEEKKPLI